MVEGEGATLISHAITGGGHYRVRVAKGGRDIVLFFSASPSDRRRANLQARAFLRRKLGENSVE